MRFVMLDRCVTWWSCGPPWSWGSLFSSCGLVSSCGSGGERGSRRQSGSGCPSLCTTHEPSEQHIRSEWLYKLYERANQSVKENKLPPGVVLSAVWGLGLGGASVSGGGAWRRVPAAPGAAALPEVGFAPRLLLLPAWRVRVAPRWRRLAPVVRLTPTGAVVTLGRVAPFWPGVTGKVWVVMNLQFVFTLKSW